jgi:hypothetical protein
MPRETKKKVLFKKESERSKTEKLIRDLVCYGVVIYAAVMGFLVVNANVNLANAQAAYISNSIVTQHAIN